MKGVVCGGRHFHDVQLLWRTLDWLDASMPEPGIAEVIDGASDDVTGPYIGADYWAREWARARNKPSSRLHAKWEAEGRAAGPRRNAEMLSKYAPDFVLAFKGGRGTDDMVKKAVEARVFVIDLRNLESIVPAISGALENTLIRLTSKAPWRALPASQDKGGAE